MKTRIKPFTEPSGLYQQIERHVLDKDIKGKNILDIGCGSGWIEEMLLLRGANKITAIDISDDVIRKAKRKKLKKTVYLTASAIDLPFKKNSFDTIVSSEVIEHIPAKTEQKMFDEMKRVLKPGGVFYLTTPHKNLIVQLFDPAWWFAGHRHYSENQMEEYCKKANLKIKRLYVRGGFYTVFLFLSMYISKWITHRSPLFYNYLLKNSREEFKENKGFMGLFLHGAKSSKK